MEKKVVLSFSPESTYNPVAYELVKNYDIRINILKAEIETGKGGKLLLSLEAEPDRIEKAIEYLKDNGIGVSTLANKVHYDSSLCMNCGSCALSCPTSALSIGPPDWKLQFDADRCILCKICLKSCPLKLFSIEFSA